MEIKVRYYSAPWCHPCKQFSPVVEEWCRENNYELVKIDIDVNPQAAKDAGVRGVPTVIMEVNGEDKCTIVGSTAKQALDNLFVACLPPR